MCDYSMKVAIMIQLFFKTFLLTFEARSLRRGEDIGRSENEAEKCIANLETSTTLNEISVLCNIPVPETVRVAELAKFLRVNKQSLTDILEIHFSDGRIIVDNLLQILESDVTLHIEKHEAELALRLNSAVYNGDSYRMRRLVAAGLDPNKTDYDGRSPLVLIFKYYFIVVTWSK
ncbi:hypothetical protein L1887_14672 [Cichorium endivia]|nr:hypothetical protein L1887_14672 [Cichorium endivia]